MMRKQISGLSFVVGVDKPAGMTSHDVVNRCRSLFKESRVGHMGTLDPFATGVLPVCIGPATRLNAFASQAPKTYRATISLGSSTDTDDGTGAVISSGFVPPDALSTEYAQTLLEGFLGVQEQVPPAYSAIKLGGTKAYEAARLGKEMELAPRTIEVHRVDLVACERDGDGAIWVVDFDVSKGTYIRALARDIGERIGCGGHLQALERLSVGTLTLDECVTLEDLARRGVDAAIDPFKLIECERIDVSENISADIRNGKSIDLSELPEQTDLKPGEQVGLVHADALQAIYDVRAGGKLVPSCVFSLSVRCK